MTGETLGEVIRRLRRLGGLHGDLAQSDAQLLDRFARRRDESAFAALMVRHGPIVLGVCRRLLHDSQEAEDAFQASFLILARKAGGVRRQALLGGWLYGVAYRVAARLRGRAARRRERLRSGVDLNELPADAVSCSDVAAVVQEEVGRLPAKYRSAVILCHLEGKTNEEAAVLLRRPVGTVKSRLTRARELLRTRLTRRGMALSGGALTAALAAHPASAPAALLDATVHAAAHLAGGDATAGGLVSARVITLIQGVLQTMWLTKLTTAAALALVVGILGGAGGLAYRSLAAEPDDPPKAAPMKPPSEEKPKDDRQAIKGLWRVVSIEMDGKERTDVDAKKGRIWSFGADRFDLTLDPLADGGVPHEAGFTYRLDPAQTPKVLDVFLSPPPDQAKPYKTGTYSLEGDALKITCSGLLPNRERVDEEEGHTVLYTLKRMEVKKERPDEEAIQGSWRVTAVETDGKDQDDDHAKKLKTEKWVFTADKVTTGAPERKAAYNLDATKFPKKLDVIPAYPPGEVNEGVIPAIYQLRGDALKICLGALPSQIKQRDQDLGRRPMQPTLAALLAPLEARRPKEMATREGGYSTLLTLKREPTDEDKAKGDKAAPAPDLSKFPLLQGKVDQVLGSFNGYIPPKAGEPFQLELKDALKLKSLTFDPAKKSVIGLPGPVVVESIQYYSNGVFQDMRLVSKEGKEWVTIDVVPKPGSGPTRVLVWVVVQREVVEGVALIDCEYEGAFPDRPK